MIIGSEEVFGSFLMIRQSSMPCKPGSIRSRIIRSYLPFFTFASAFSTSCAESTRNPSFLRLYVTSFTRSASSSTTRICFGISMLSYIRLCYIPAHHPMAVKIVGIFADGILHHSYPGLAVIVIGGDYYIFEFFIEVFCINSIHILIRPCICWRRTDCPPCVSFNMPFNPPSVKHAEIHHSIMCCLHTACA